MASLMDIPGLGAYLQREQMDQQQQARQLQTLGALQQIAAQQRSAQDEQELKGVVAQAGGDPARAVEALLKAGTPKSIELASKLKGMIAKPPERRVVAPGGALVNDDGSVVYQAPFKPEKEAAPSGVARLIAERDALPAGDPRRAIFDAALKKETEGLRQPRETYPIVTTGDGIFERRPEGLVPLKDPRTGQPLKPTARERPITEYQGKNALYGSRALQADKVLHDLETKINLVGLATKQSIQGTPLIGGALGAAANTFLSANQQSVEQAQRNFVNAVLRQESGAVISDAEFENAKKQYFPQPGDKPQVIEQKRKNRKTAIEGFKRIAGPAWNEVEENPVDALLDKYK